MRKRAVRRLVSEAVRAWDCLRNALRGLAGRPPVSRCVVLYYHAVPASQRHLFAAQMDDLLRRAKPLSTGNRSPLEPGSLHAVVTFDDAFVSVLENAIPELQKRNIPSTVFIPSGCLGQPPSWIERARPEVHRERVMTADELRTLAADPSVTLASHSVAHPNFLRLTPDRARHELAESKATLEEVLRRPVDQFSFPYGAHEPSLHRLAGELGYRRLFTSDPLPAFGDPREFVTGRVSVDPDDPPREFRLKLAGAYRWLGHLQVARRRRRHPSNP